MKKINNILICGIGAIGSIYADKIQRYNPENLRILVDEKRLERYKKNPIIFNGKELNLTYILPSQKDFKADLIIIATKYEGLKEAVKNIKNFVYEDTVILSLLNGVTSEEIIAQKYGIEKLLYSYFIGHSAVREGRNVTQDGVNTIVFGAADNNGDENVSRVKDYFDCAGINYEIPQDIIYSLWLKFMLNASSNQISAILKMTFGQLYSNKKCLKLMINVMKEVQQIAKAEGVKNTQSLIDNAVEYLFSMTPEGKTSMLQDVEAGRNTEVEMFAGTIIELGKKHKIPTPYNMVFKELIGVIEDGFSL